MMEGDFAPDPRWCVHSATGEGREHLRLRSLATAESRVIAWDDDAWLYSPRFSPSGRLVACVRDPGFTQERRPAGIEVLHFNGSGRRTVADDADEDFNPIFSPDERHIAYVNLKGNLCVVSVGGGNARVAIDDPQWRALGEPVWSPDGTRLAVTCMPREAESSLARRAVTPTRIVWAGIGEPQSGFVRGAELLGWHTEDSLLAALRGFVVPAGTSYERLAAVGLDGSIRRVLREAEAVLDCAVESPDGQWVAAVGWHGDDSWDVYLHDTEARTTAKVTSASLSGRPEVGWTTEGELWVSAEGDAGVLIRPGDRSARAVARPPELVPRDESRGRFACQRGDLFEGKAIGRPGPLGMTGVERRTYFNAQVTLAPTTNFGGGS
jgi:dipeptidyl aminopeptidase/acylaminoacyl peptidase